MVGRKRRCLRQQLPLKLIAKKVYLVFPGATNVIALLSINVALIIPENMALFSVLCT